MLPKAVNTSALVMNGCTFVESMKYPYPMIFSSTATAYTIII